MLADLTDILGRRKFAKKIAGSQLTIDQHVNGDARLASIARPVATPRIAPDPDDDVVIVTGDKPLLTVSEHQGVRIVGVAEAIEAIDARSKT